MALSTMRIGFHTTEIVFDAETLRLARSSPGRLVTSEDRILG
jgi:hypothetical protein